MSAHAIPVWPALREELRLHHGASDANGQPSWTIQDPVRHRFIRIDWVTYEILRRWWMANPDQIADDIGKHSTLQVSPADVSEVLALALREELVQPVTPPASATKQTSGSFPAGLQWLLHHYLFFRIPLVQPDRWLERLLPMVAWLGSAAFTRLSCFALLGGLLGISQQSEALGAQWLDLLSWQGLVLYGITLALVKLAHELGHALVAKQQGCRVPSMGVAMMVLWPVAYTDTTEAWRLADSKARLRIAAAGVRTELTIAAWATLAWTWLPDSGLRTAMFILATMTWITSLLINLSPFMRFDGYFVLCDILGEPNLHERTFALARWWLRSTLLGWTMPSPEETSAAAKGWMIAFAMLTWLYRLSLYLGIAWMVYHIGFKALGLLLFAVEAGWFIAGPVWREWKTWYLARSQWLGQRRAYQSAVVACILMLMGFVPWASHETGAAMIQPAQHLALRLPGAVIIDELMVQPGQRIHAGQVLLRAIPPSLVQQMEETGARLQALEREVAMASISPEQQSRWSSLQAELRTTREQMHTLRGDMTRYQPAAPFDGIVTEVNPSLKVGLMSPPSREVLMHLATPDKWQVVAYANESAIGHLRRNDQVTIVADASPLHNLHGHIVSLSPSPSAQLDEPLLAQTNGGQIEAREIASGWLPTQTIYRVNVTLDEPLALPPRAWRGHAVFASEAANFWQRCWTWLFAAMIKESGF